jgi:predicted ATP-dependent endonuclease of OLD family
LKAAFSDIFPNVGFDVFEKPGVSNGPIIMIFEGEKEYDLRDSAAGYFEVLHILSSLSALGADDMLVIDEPALHLHPLRVRYFGKKMAAFAKRQVILFTHSPYFVNIWLFGTNQCLIKVQKDAKGSSKILDKQRQTAFTFSIKPYHFKPDIFFSRCNVFVEGASDANALTAISDALRNVFEVNDILLVDSGGKDNLDKYVELIELYELPYVAMADHDYVLGSRKITADFTILPGRLEDELAKLDSGRAANTAVKNINGTICSNNKTKSIDATRAYELIYNKMNTDRKNVKDTNLAIVFNQALAKVGITNPEEVWDRDSG